MKTSEQSMNNWPKIHAPTCGTCMSEAQKKAHVRNTPPHVHRACALLWAVSEIQPSKVGARQPRNNRHFSPTVASYKEKYLVKYLVAGSASYGLWCNISCLLRLVPGPCRLQCLTCSQLCPGYMTQQMPWDCLWGLVFFLKLTYLGPTCRRSKMIPFLLI